MLPGSTPAIPEAKRLRCYGGECALTAAVRAEVAGVQRPFAFASLQLSPYRTSVTIVSYLALHAGQRFVPCCKTTVLLLPSHSRKQSQLSLLRPSEM